MQWIIFCIMNNKYLGSFLPWFRKPINIILLTTFYCFLKAQSQQRIGKKIVKKRIFGKPHPVLILSQEVAKSLMSQKCSLALNNNYTNEKYCFLNKQIRVCSSIHNHMNIPKYVCNIVLIETSISRLQPILLN